jgi:hypothetical protein
MATTVLLPLITLKLLYHCKKNPFIILFIANFFLSAFTELILAFFHLFKTQNLFIVNIFCLAQFVVLSIAFIKLLPISTSKFKILSFLLVGFISAYAIMKYTIFNRVAELDSISNSIESIILFVLAGINLIFLSKDSEIPMTKNYKFWFIAGSFLYFCISIIIFSTGEIILEDKVTLTTYTWVINSILTIGTNAMYFTGILCLPQKKK